MPGTSPGAAAMTLRRTLIFSSRTSSAAIRPGASIATWHELDRLLERRAEGLLDDHPHLGALPAVQALLAQPADDHREERRRRRQVEAAVQPMVGLLVEGVHRPGERGAQIALV